MKLNGLGVKPISRGEHLVDLSNQRLELQQKKQLHCAGRAMHVLWSTPPPFHARLWEVQYHNSENHKEWLRKDLSAKFDRLEDRLEDYYSTLKLWGGIPWKGFSSSFLHLRTGQNQWVLWMSVLDKFHLQLIRSWTGKVQANKRILTRPFSLTCTVVCWSWPERPFKAASSGSRAREK